MLPDAKKSIDVVKSPGVGSVCQPSDFIFLGTRRIFNMSISQLRLVCIHGHFYQPPRENPSLEYVERQAAPGDKLQLPGAIIVSIAIISSRDTSDFVT
jgi:hypothetical protein